MSNSPSTATDDLPRPADLRDALPLSDLGVVAAPLRFVAFWTAVALPFLYLPLLVGGLGGGQTTAFVSLLLLNVAALVLGHDYGR